MKRSMTARRGVARFVAACLAAAALAVGVGSAAAAPPNFTPAERLCTSQGGTFSTTFFAEYRCLAGERSTGFTENQLRAAEQLCERGYAGAFFSRVEDNREYQCATQPV